MSSSLLRLRAQPEFKPTAWPKRRCAHETLIASPAAVLRQQQQRDQHARTSLLDTVTYWRDYSVSRIAQTTVSALPPSPDLMVGYAVPIHCLPRSRAASRSRWSSQRAWMWRRVTALGPSPD